MGSSMLTDQQIDELVPIEEGRVHSRLYTDPEIFQQEMQRIFYRTWVYVGHTSEIAEPGDYKTTHIGLVPVIVARDEDGEVNVLVNRCVHRGTTVCQQEYGNSNYFRCEYHGWTYKNNGSLIGITLRKGFKDGELDGIAKSLDRAPRVAIYRGLIFASLSPTGLALEEWLGVAKDYLDVWLDTSPTGEMVVSGGIWKHDYTGNWKIGMEGSDERYHINFLHHVAVVLNKRRTGQTSKLKFMPDDMTALETKDAGHGHGISEINSERWPMPWRDMYPQAYIDALVARIGEERTAHVLRQDFRLHLFPNVAFGPENIRVFRPISVDHTEVRQYHVALPTIPGVTDELNAQRVVVHRKFYGPAGYVGADDLEIFPRMMEGYRAQSCDTLNPWVWFSRGATTTRRGPGGERIGEDQSEVSQQSIWYGWREYMKAAGETAALPSRSAVRST
jgi:phenylpropionate dioxygenase-like ring-hydroxylating dioxygenase large terminal subunit